MCIDYWVAVIAANSKSYSYHDSKGKWRWNNLYSSFHRGAHKQSELYITKVSYYIFVITIPNKFPKFVVSLGIFLHLLVCKVAFCEIIYAISIIDIEFSKMGLMSLSIIVV